MCNKKGGKLIKFRPFVLWGVLLRLNVYPPKTIKDLILRDFQIS